METKGDAKVLYYPHYTPSKLQLRSILLFSDNLNLIVPSIDQYGVRSRSNVRDLIEFEPSLIEFRDPEYRYSGWASRKGIDGVLESLLDEVGRDIEDAGLDTIIKDRNGHANAGQDEIISDLWSRRGWKFVAAEKIPQRIRDAIFQSDAAARVGIVRNPQTNQIFENNGVLCHPKLGDFILSRMAREASFKEGIPSITFGGIDYANHLFDGEHAIQRGEHALFQSSVDLFVPDDIETFSTSEFLEIRRDYSDLRRSLWSYLGTMASESNLNLDRIDQDALLQNLAHARDQIIEDLVQVTRFIGRQKFRSQAALAFEAAATLGGAAFGAIFSGPTGAMTGAGIGLAGGKLASKLSTVEKDYDGRLKSIAMTKAKIEKRRSRRGWDAPSYWKD